MTLCIQPVKYVKHQTVEQWAVLVPAQDTTVLQRLGFEPQVADYKPKEVFPSQILLRVMYVVLYEKIICKYFAIFWRAVVCLYNNSVFPTKTLQ